MRKSINTKAFLLGGAALACLFEPAFAQTRDEIIVTVRRKAESLQDVPGSITALTDETLSKAGVERGKSVV